MKMYVEDEMSSTDIAFYFGVDKGTAVGWLKTAKVRLRSKSEAALRRIHVNKNNGKINVREPALYSGSDAF